MKEKNRPGERPEQDPWWRPGLALFSRLSGWIGIPVVLALFLGKWLDEKYGTKPWLFLACVGLSFFISSAGIVLEAKKAMSELEGKNGAEDDKDRKKNKEGE